MFVDKLSARILIFRHYLEIEYDDNETFKWTETLFNDLLQRKMLLNYFKTNTNQLTSRFVFTSDMRNLIKKFEEVNNFEFELSKSGLLSNSKILNERINKFNTSRYEFINAFDEYQNRFLVIQFDDFLNSKNQFDSSLKELYQKKIEYIDFISDILWLQLSHRHILSKLAPNESTLNAYRNLGMQDERELYLLSNDLIFEIYLENFSSQYYIFKKDLTISYIKNKYPDLVNEIQKTLHSGGWIITPKKYERIMDDVSKKMVHLELILTAYDGYDFDIAKENVQVMTKDLM